MVKSTSKDTVTEDVELFVRKTKLISKSTKKTMEIHNFIKEIEDEDQKLNAISSPKFKLDGVDFSIDVYPDSDGSDTGFIGVHLHNYGEEDQVTSVTIKEVSGEETSWETATIRAGGDWGFFEFLSHDEYRELAKVHGDVLKLDVVVTLHTKAEGDGWTRTKIMPELSTQETSFKTILDDDATADFTIRCETKEFRVHKAILCARSPVFRASILTDMQEAKKGEIFVKEIGEKSLATLISFIYTGELELGEDPDILELSWAGTKYLLSGFMEILSVSLQMRKEELGGKMLADLLIAALRHESEDLWKIALDKIRGNRKIFNDQEFRKGMEGYLNILMDVFKDL